MKTSPTEIIKNALNSAKIRLKANSCLAAITPSLWDVQHEGAAYQAVYKPCKGEQPLLGFSDNTLAQREVPVSIK